jgi:hypothetical protein
MGAQSGGNSSLPEHSVLQDADSVTDILRLSDSVRSEQHCGIVLLTICANEGESLSASFWFHAARDFVEEEEFGRAEEGEDGADFFFSA